MVILLAVVITRGTPKIVGRLIRSRQLAHPFGLPVYVARLPPAPFCETPIAWSAPDTGALQFPGPISVLSVLDVITEFWRVVRDEVRDGS
jgi:hypothetical protein